MRLQIFDANLNDLIQLKDLSEFALLYKLMLRYHDREIYTFVGAVLVAVRRSTWYTLPHLPYRLTCSL